MRINILIYGIVGAIFMSDFSFAQGKTDVLDVWTKRVSRIVVLGDSSYIARPKLKNENEEQTLGQMLCKAAAKGAIQAYNMPDTKFALPALSRKAVQELIDIFPPDTLEVDDGDGVTSTKIVKTDIAYDQVRKYKVLEEWTYDIKKAKTTIYIVGIAPYTPPDIVSKSGKVVGDYPLFWIRYDDVKSLLIEYQQSHPNCNIPLSVWNSYFTETQ